MSTLFDSFNQKILKFVSDPANRKLQAGTGSYSTPFRGTLFKLPDAARVAAKLATERVDVLWLSANPNVNHSVRKIVASGANTGDFASFQKQITSGAYGEQRWEGAGAPQVGWDPFGRPVGGWVTYAELMAKVARPDHIAMANFIPWGSAGLTTLCTSLGASDPALLARLLRFSDDLNTEITLALRPRLIVVPKNQGEGPELRNTGISSSRVSGLESHSVKLSKQTFRYTTGTIDRGGKPWPVAFLPLAMIVEHKKADRLAIVESVAPVLQRVMTA